MNEKRKIIKGIAEHVPPKYAWRAIINFLNHIGNLPLKEQDRVIRLFYTSIGDRYHDEHENASKAICLIEGTFNFATSVEGRKFWYDARDEVLRSEGRLEEIAW